MGLRFFEPCDYPAGVGCTIFEDPENIHLAVHRSAFYFSSRIFFLIGS